VTLGSIAALFDWNWTAAEMHYQQALEMNPGYATAHQWYAHDLLPGVGRLAEAEAELERARECDPLSVIVLASSAENMFLQRRPAEAIEYHKKALELDPYFPRAHFGLARALLLLGHRDEAVAAIGRATALNPRSAMALALACNLYAVVGRKTDARVNLAELEDLVKTTRVAPYLMMRAWMGLDPERACKFLELACEDRDPRLLHAGASPAFDSMRGMTRFDSVLRRMGLAVEPVPA
jgi:tetratricopeptide (TPR) repeat protein